MKVEIKEAPPVEPTYEINMKLAKKELQLLIALTDFPEWSEQPDEVEGFLHGLNALLSEGIPFADQLTPKQIGMTKHVNVY